MTATRNRKAPKILVRLQIIKLVLILLILLLVADTWWNVKHGTGNIFASGPTNIWLEKGQNVEIVSKGILQTQEMKK